MGTRPCATKCLRLSMIITLLTASALPLLPGAGAGVGDATETRPQEGNSGELVNVSPGHKEVRVAPPSVPVDRAAQPRSPRAIVTRGSIQSVQVNVDFQQNNIVGDAANEPTLAVDPTNPNNIVIGWRQFDSIASDHRQAGMAYSHDGGATWTFPGSLDPGQFRSDPVLATDLLGTFYYYSISSVTTGEYFVSTDKGVNWTGPISSPAGDKNWQIIDATGGQGDGNIYPIWNSQFTCCDPGTDFSRSTNGTVSFDGPYVLPQHPKWGTDDVGPNGELYIVGATLDQSGHLLLRSDNAENALAVPTFSLATSIDLGGTTGSGGSPNPGGLLGQVWVAADRSNGPTRGNVYVLGSVSPSGSDPLDVHIIRSEDRGQTWSSPLRVNDDPADNGAYQWFGTMSVAPDGRIDVAWNDTRAGQATISELYYAYSTDAGATFSAGLPVSPSFDSTVGHPQQNKIGDYYHMISSTADAALAYSATFNGEQDVYFVRLGDCNTNGAHDSTDVSGGSSDDVNANGIPDECEPDCNGNGVPDEIDLSSGTSDDCNGNQVPDECDVVNGTSNDCDGNTLLDECEVDYDLESNQGFTVGADDDTATTGVWVRVDPVGTLAQPENDHTLGAGTDCYVTGQGVPGGGLGDNDVDGGKTTLYSLTLDLTAMSEPWIGYWRWYSNDTGGAANEDTFVVDISNDGGDSWANVEIVGPAGPGTSGGWYFHIFRVSDELPPTSNVVLRFVASDLNEGSLIEAAIDDLVVIDCGDCELPIPGEVEGLLLGRTGHIANLTWDAEPNAATYAVYRGTLSDASDLMCIEYDVLGTSTDDSGFGPFPGQVRFYVTTADNCAGESVLGFDRTPSIPCP
jgi:hypothetical protein